MRETQPRVLLERKAKRLRASTGSQDLVSRLARTDSANQILVQALVRPMSLLFRSPILLVISLYVALVFGLLYILFTTFSPVFEGQYGFTTSTSGLVYLGLGIALVLDVLLFSAINSRVQTRILKSHGLQRPLPEHRLVLMIFLSPFVAVGMFIYGWTVHYKVHWIVPIVGTTFVGFGAFFVVVSPHFDPPHHTTTAPRSNLETLALILVIPDARTTLHCRSIWVRGCCVCAQRQPSASICVWDLPAPSCTEHVQDIRLWLGEHLAWISSPGVYSRPNPLLQVWRTPPSKRRHPSVNRACGCGTIL